MKKKPEKRKKVNLAWLWRAMLRGVAQETGPLLRLDVDNRTPFALRVDASRLELQGDRLALRIVIEEEEG
jgi:hypothetical protein